MAVKVIKARNTDPVITTAQIPITRAAAYCRVSTDSDEQETSYEVAFKAGMTVEIEI